MLADEAPVHDTVAVARNQTTVARDAVETVDVVHAALGLHDELAGRDGLRTRCACASGAKHSAHRQIQESSVRDMQGQTSGQLT